MNRVTLPRLAMTAVVAALALLTTACGDDDGDEAESTTTEAPAEGASSEAFCTAVIDVEKAFSSQGESDPAPAIKALEESTPEGSEDVVATMLDEAQKLQEAEAPPGEEFNAAHADLLDVTRDNCDFGEVEATAKDYEFSGIPDEVDAGNTILSLSNEGAEVHEMILMRINDDVTESAEEILALPEEEGQTKTTTVGAAFAYPGGTPGATVADLEPGRYMVSCFIPVGATPEAMEAMMTGGSQPDGPQHFMEGMVTEFTVS
ncbi:MAG TPA: hypothetical protein VJM33_12010 [Microthrixaceae bacterium]|nr:hypothetical protein [Microthrixaceae bacterium]